MARTLIGTVPCPVMKMIEALQPAADRDSWRSSPDSPGIRTSITRQEGRSGRPESRNSEAEGKLLTSSPTDRTSLSREWRTETSSSRTYTMGTEVSASIGISWLCAVVLRSKILRASSVNLILNNISHRLAHLSRPFYWTLVLDRPNFAVATGRQPGIGPVYSEPAGWTMAAMRSRARNSEAARAAARRSA